MANELTEEGICLSPGGVRSVWRRHDCNIAFAKLYTEKTPITAADLLNDWVLPFHGDHGLPVLPSSPIAQ